MQSLMKCILWHFICVFIVCRITTPLGVSSVQRVKEEMVMLFILNMPNYENYSQRTTTVAHEVQNICQQNIPAYSQIFLRLINVVRKTLKDRINTS